VRERVARHRVATFTVTLAAGLVVMVAVWVGVVFHQRTDVSRCGFRPPLHADAVELGGWAEPDRCTYRDSAGLAAYVDGDLAEPVDTAPFGPFAAGGLIGSGIGAAFLVASARRKYPASAADTLRRAPTVR
jgi:hypothetical protein